MGMRWGIGAALALAAPAKSVVPWFEASSAHFRVYTQGAADKARAMATRLEQFDRGMRELRAIPDDPATHANPVTIYVVPGTADIVRLCAQNQKQRGRCSSVAGFYQGGGAGAAAVVPQALVPGTLTTPQVVLFHEYTHHLMFQNNATAYPAWFSEGFAEFNSTAEPSADGGMSFGKIDVARAYSLLYGSRMSMQKLLTGTTASLDNQEVLQLYARGWLLTHYLTMEPSRQGQLRAYLVDFAAGTPSLKAAEKAFGPLLKLNGDLDAYLHRPMHYIVQPPSKVAAGPVTVHQLSPGASAMMPIRIRSKHGVDPKTSAQAVVADARRIATAFPDDPAVQVALAEAEFDAGFDEAAESAADRALKADPQEMGALLYKGRVHLRRAARAKTDRADGAAWAEARTWYLRANRLYTDAALPLYLYYCSYLVQGIAPTANAKAALERAFVLAPQDGEVRMVLARQLLQDGRRDDLRAVLAPAAYDPHAAADNPAAKLIALIDGKADDAALRAALPPIDPQALLN